MLWVHVAADFNAIVSKHRKSRSDSSGTLKKRLKSKPAPPGSFCASVHCKGVKSYVSFCGICVQMHSFWAPAITVPKAGRLALSTIDTVLPIGRFLRSQLGYAKAVAMDTL
jgi:hypothetical protein